MIRRLGAGLVLAGILCLSQGCSYLQNRARDSLELADIGLTFSTKPCFSAFVIFPPIHLTLIGIGEVDGWFAGLGGGGLHVWSPYYQRSIGLALWGEETVSFGKGRVDLEGLSEEELREEATFYRSGLFGLIQGPLPEADYEISCPHYLHIGWIGAVVSPRYSEALDFILGWTTLDIGCDDIPAAQ